MLRMILMGSLMACSLPAASFAQDGASQPQKNMKAIEGNTSGQATNPASSKDGGPDAHMHAPDCNAANANKNAHTMRSAESQLSVQECQ